MQDSITESKTINYILFYGILRRGSIFIKERDRKNIRLKVLFRL